LCSKLDKKSLDLILFHISEIADLINQGNFDCGIYLDDEGVYVRFEPFKFQKFTSLKFKPYESYNEAIDDYFAKFDSNLLLADGIKSADKILGKYQRIHDAQEIQIQESIEKREEHLNLGNLLFQNYQDIESLLNTVLSARKNGMKWEDIEERINKGKEKGIQETLLFEKSFPKEGKISVIIEGKKIKLDIRKSVVDNANDVYKLAKKDKRRIEGAKEALKKTSKTLKEKKFQKEASMKKKVSLVKRPRKNWYEKFRWFISSDGFLIVGGKDVSSNEVIVKKHLEKNDLYFHTDSRGAPSVILKNPENKEIPEQTFKETACFAASYSNAWREGWGSAKIFFVNPDQVTKSPNPGEYLKKGSFFIKGKKNFVPKPFLELAIGLKLENVGEMENNVPDSEKKEINFVYFPRIIAGPPTAIKKTTENYVRIVPQKSRAVLFKIQKLICRNGLN
jgi:predicted ribosome quality control (RQC) complex YloA/Tae2 family protein